MTLIYAAELTAYALTTASVATHYYANAGFVTGATDTPPHTAFDPRIQQPALMHREVFSNGQAFGQSRVGYGELTLINTDGALDFLLQEALDGRRLTLRVGTAGAAYPAEWTTILTATMDAPSVEWNLVSIRLRDRLQDLQPPVQKNLYAGNNALPEGLEGTEQDLKGRPKPLAYGVVRNATLPCVNTSKLIYQANDGALQSVDAVYDRGVALTAGTAYSSLSDLETNAPAAGSYRAWLTGGYVRLGSSPTGTLTADVTQGASAAARTTAQILQALALRAGVSAGEIVSADVTALDAANPAEIGLWLNTETSALAALDTVANSIGAWYGFDALGRLRMGQMTEPTGTPCAVLQADTLISMALQATASGSSNIPPQSIELRYAPNETPQDTDLAGSVTAARRAWLKEPWRSVTAAGASLTVHPLAEPLSLDTRLVKVSDAQAEANRRALLLGGRRDRLTVKVQLDAARLTALELGAVIHIVHPRFGYSAGKAFRIMELQTDLRRGYADLTVWG